KRTSYQGAECENKGRSGRKRIQQSRAFVQQKLYTQPAASDELAQNRIRQRHTFGSARGEVDSKVRAVIAERHWFLTRPRPRKGSAHGRFRQVPSEGRSRTDRRLSWQ